MTDNFKTCTKCGERKPQTDQFFSRNSVARGGLKPHCCECGKRYTREYRRRNKEIINARRRAEYAVKGSQQHRSLEIARAIKFPFRCSAEMLVRGVRNRCKERGYEVAPQLLDKSYVEAWLRKQPNCECCGVPFVLGRRGAGHRGNEASPSFDRFNSDAGYTIGNTALICWRCNAVKKHYSSVELRCVADWIDSRLSERAA